jgi:Flp pilus assembly protein TadD
MFEDDGPSAPDPVAPVEYVETSAYREPPVCGEWSYDDAELEDARFVARRIDGVALPTSKATPVQPITVIPSPRAVAARSAAPPTAAPASHHKSAVANDPRVTLSPRLSTDAGANRSLRPTIEALRLAFEQTPSDTVRALAYAAALERSGDAAAALRVLDAAWDASADPFAITCARASALGAQLKYDDAAKMLKKAAKLKPEDAEILVQSGILSCRRGRWKDAVEPLQKGASLVPEHPTVHYFIGEALNHTDRLADALAAYERAAELDPENWRALKGVGIVLDRLGRSPEAAVFYRRARDAQRA